MDKNSYEIRLCELISASLECCLAAVSFAWSFISPLALVHPFPLRGPSPQGETRRDGTPLLLLKHAKYSAELATFGGSPPYPALPDSPPKGKRLTTFCASLSLLQNVFAVHPRESVSHDSQVALLPYSTAITDSQYFARHCVPSSTAVTDSLDFRVADAPLQIQFA